MKKFISGALMMLLALESMAQSPTRNYIITTTPLLPVSDVNTLGVTQKRTEIQYLDGLGRPVQHIAYRQSPSMEDLVQIRQYDLPGRETKQYLPYAGSSPSLNFRTGAVSEQAYFYKNKARVAHSDYPYAETVFDNSPLNRVVEQSAPGAAWKLGSGHTQHMAYGTNGANEVRLWQLSGSNVISSGYYQASQLQWVQSTDEHGMNILEYTDKQGRTVLKKAQVQASPDVYTYTHYVYNNLNRLVCVIPPEAAEAINTSGVYNIDTQVPERVYRYTYDARGRVTEKKIPHKGWEYIIYDKLDRPVLTQDANQRPANEWSFTRYDVLGRVVMTGLCIRTGSPESLQATLDAAAFIYEIRVPVGSTDYYDIHGYTNRCFPTMTTGVNNNVDILRVFYYDDYDFNNNGSPDKTFSSPPTGYTAAATARTRGLQTGIKIKVMDDALDIWLLTTTWYDEKGRAIQTAGDNHLGGSDIIHHKYNFTGELLSTRHVHSDGSNTLAIDKRFTYDHAGRLLKTYQSMDGEDEIILADHNYNALGQLTEKNLHGIPPSGSQMPEGWEQPYLQSVDYAYNIRGWLTHINNADLKKDEYNDNDPYTGEVVGYDFNALHYSFSEEEDNNGPYIQMEIIDDTELLVEGTVDTDRYDHGEGMTIRLLEYADGDGRWEALQELDGQDFENYYSSTHTIDRNTEYGELLDELESWIYPEVDDHISYIGNTEAIALVQNAVFNYVAGKAAHIIPPDSIVFPQDELKVHFVEKNGYQLYLHTQAESDPGVYTDIFLMDRTGSNYEEYDNLLALTREVSGEDTTVTPVGLDFSQAGIYEGAGIREAVALYSQYAENQMQARGVQNDLALAEAKKLAVSYAVQNYGNVFFNNDENDLWGMELKYNTTSAVFGGNPLNSAALYNGNIAEMHWKSKGDNVRRGYGYRYDGLSRLTQATYKAFNYNNDNWDQEQNRYSVPQITYDRNGNILTLQRNGYKSGTMGSPVFGLMDNLVYGYGSGGDLLRTVQDQSGIHHINDFYDGNFSGYDYLYDSNGNLTRDLNKGIDDIIYNHLNLPVEVEKDATHRVTYIYDAAGNKLRKTVTNGSTVTQTDYTAIGNYTKVNSGPLTLDFIFTNEGRAVDDGGVWRYEYYYKDHLGNTRLGFSDYDEDETAEVGEITQQSNYYPFGLEHKGTDYGVATQTTHKYLFNGKELQDEFNLGWTAMDWRGLDHQTGRFFGIDPLAEEAYDWSSYRFGYNNPISFGDPTGLLEDWYKNDEGDIVWHDRTDQNFTDDKGSNWENVGKTLDDVKQHLNVPSDQSVSQSDMEWITIGGEEGGGGMLAPVSVQMDAHISFDLKTNQKSFPSKLVDGETKVTGISMNVSLIASTSNTINFESMGGSFSFDKEWTPTGFNARIQSSPFQKVNQDVIGNFNTYSYSSATANLKLNHFQRAGGNNTIYIKPAIRYSNNADGFKSGILTPFIEKTIR